MKRKDRFFLQLSRKLFHDPEFQKLSINAKWLYVVLNELEHRFSGNKEDFFFRSNNDLAKDAGFSLPTLLCLMYAPEVICKFSASPKGVICGNMILESRP